MKITVHGPRAGYGPDGTIHSWGPDQAVEVPDGDKKAVAWARVMVSTGAAALEEDVKTAAPKTAAQAPKTAARAEPAKAETAARRPATR